MVITRINNNITALNATRNLNRSSSNLAKSLERLSSGLRINRAADDASGLSISERLRSQIRGLNRAMANAQDAINLVNAAEGALNETTSILQRIRELSVQAANSGGQDAASIQFAQDEIESAIAEITRTGAETQFSTRFLLNGDNANTVSVTGADIGISIEQGPVSSGLSAGDHFLVITGTDPTASVTVGTDGILNSGAIISAANAVAHTFDTGTLSLVVANAQAESTRVLDSTVLTVAGTPVVGADGFDTVAFNSFEIDAGDTVVLSGTDRDGNAVTMAALTVVAGTANTPPFDIGNVTGLLNAINNIFDPNGTPGVTAPAVQDGDEFATVILNADGTMTLTEELAGNSQVSLTISIYDGGTSLAVQEGLTVTTAGNPNQAAVSLANGTSQSVEAGETYTLRGPDPPPSDSTSPTPTMTIQFGGDATYTFSNGTDEIIVTAGAYSATLDGGRATKLQNGDQGIRLFTGTGGGFEAGEQILLNADSTIPLTAGIATTVLTALSNALNFQIGANAGQQVAIQIGDLRATNLGYVGGYSVNGSVFQSDGSPVTSSSTGALERTVANLNVTTIEGANEAIAIIDRAISQVSAQRSALGAFTNRLESTVNNLGMASENLSTSESRIRDADIAYETTIFTRNQILVAAGTSILAQANLAPQAVLQLLG